MAENNPQRERQRLAELYRGMADGELEELASEATTLSDVAKAALEAELSRRKLPAALAATAATTALPPAPITLARFRDLPDALLAKTILDSAAVDCFLADENTIRMDWLWSNAIGGIKLWVRPADVDAAELLNQDWIETFNVEGVGEYKQPRCPNCGSFDISFQELVKPLAYGSMLVIWLVAFFVLIPLHRSGWKCHSCEHEWEGDEVAGGTA